MNKARYKLFIFRGLINENNQIAIVQFLKISVRLPTVVVKSTFFQIIYLPKLNKLFTFLHTTIY